METKKRKASDQLDFLLKGIKKSNESTSDSKVVFPTESVAIDHVPKPSGFAAYTRSNPFQTAAAAALKDSNGSSVFGFGHKNSTNVDIGKSFPQSRPNFILPPPLVLPSPKSPRINPFSSPSPVNNPFMTIVESKEELWKTMAKDKLSKEEVAKTNQIIGNSKNSKKLRLSDSAATDVTIATDCNNTDSAFEPKDEVNDREEDDDVIDSQNDEKDGGGVPEPFLTKTYPLPDNVSVITGEEDDLCAMQLRVKVYRFINKFVGEKSGVEFGSSVSSSSSKKDETKAASQPQEEHEWVEFGVGPLKILERIFVSSKSSLTDDKDSEVNYDGTNERQQKRIGRIVMRRGDKKGGQGTKLLLNVPLNRYTSVVRQGDKMIRLLCPNYALTEVGSRSLNGGKDLGNSKSNLLESVISSYLVKTKTSQESDELIGIINGHIQQSKTGD